MHVIVTGNAILHAGTPITLRLTRDEERQVVRITVRDGNPAHPRRRHYSALSTTGRGLAMVEKATGGFAVEAWSDGKDVWFELDASEPGPESEPRSSLAASRSVARPGREDSPLAGWAAS